jgi:hypothetical protein
MNMLDQLIFVGFHSRVAAMNRDTGELVWQWRSPKGSGYTTLLLDGDRLIVSVMGYTYCLDPLSGQQWWANDLPGMGTGVPSLASVRGAAANPHAAAAEEEANNSSAAATTTTTVTS